MTRPHLSLTYVLCGGTVCPGVPLCGVAVLAPMQSMTVEKADNPRCSHEGRRLLRCPMVRAWPAAAVAASVGVACACVCQGNQDVSRPSLGTQKTCRVHHEKGKRNKDQGQGVLALLALIPASLARCRDRGASSSSPLEGGVFLISNFLSLRASKREMPTRLTRIRTSLSSYTRWLWPLDSAERVYACAA